MKIDELYRLGFSLILLRPGKKQPLDDKWSKGPRVPLKDIKSGFAEGCNIGFRPGVTSKTEDGGYIHGIDLDIRVPEDADIAREKLRELFGHKFLTQCGRVVSGSGGDSRHFYFKLRRPMRAKTIAHSKEKFHCEKSGRMRWRWEIEVFGEGKQMVLPPSIHPDTKQEYRWTNLPDNLPFMEEGRLDDILDALTRPISDYSEEDIAPLGMEYEDAEKVLKNLDFERWFVERDGWRNVGMALHHEFNGSKAAYRLWSQYSKKAEGSFDPVEQRYQWSTFGRNQHVRPFRMASLIKEAAAEEVRAALQPTEDDIEEIKEAIASEKRRKDRRAPVETKPAKPGKYKIQQPSHLMTIPGALGEIVDLYNNTAPRPQPQFAVHSALALGSVICGRNWMSNRGNFTSLYFLILGKTASGKEHGLKLIEAVLNECELDLVGPPRYTSDAGILSALEFRPKHISLADEFSRYLKSARNSGDSNMSNAQSSLMEVWGRLGGVHRNKGYSTRGMSKEQSGAMASSHVKRPAMSMLGVAVPADFYSAMSDDDVASGFLNRFLICETEVPRLPMQNGGALIRVSDDFRKWARENAYPMVPGDEDIMDAINRNNPVEPGDPIIINFTKDATRILDRLDEKYLGLMDDLDERGLDGLYGRTLEIIMRLSVIIARSCSSDRITREHVEWSRDYVEYHMEKLVDKTYDEMGKSEDQKLVAQIYERVDEWSKDDRKQGMTLREIIKYFRGFMNLDTRGREEITKILSSDYGVVFRTVRRNNSDASRVRRVTVYTTRTDL